MKKSPPKLPPVLVLSGNHHFLRQRRLKQLLLQLESYGRITDRLDGSEKGAVSAALGAGLFFDNPTQYVVSNPQHVPPDLLRQHHQSSSTTMLILHYEGKIRSNSKFAKLIAEEKIPSETRDGPDPKKPWEADQFAIDFVVEEVKGRGYRIDAKLARALVSISGADLGILSFEIEKAILLAGDNKELTKVHLQAVSRLADAQMNPIFKALEVRSVKALAKALAKFKKATKGDPTIPICRSLGDRVMLWICAVSLADQGVPPDDAAQALGQNPWYYRNKVLPQAHKWGVGDLRELIRVLAESDRSVLSNAISPWTGLTCGLLRVCQPVST